MSLDEQWARDHIGTTPAYKGKQMTGVAVRLLQIGLVLIGVLLIIASQVL